MYVDPSGNDAVAAAAPIYKQIWEWYKNLFPVVSAADGPYPFGDVVMVVLGVGCFVLIGATWIYYEVTTESEQEVPSTKLPSQGNVKGNVEGAPPVDAGKQGKHVPGHNNNDPSRSQWKEGETGVDETQEAWQKGEILPDGTIVWDTGKVVGQNGETGVRVHIDSKGNIHGYPVDPSQYLK